MKPKGWRLDPAWVEHYSKIERERAEAEVKRWHWEHQLRQAQADLGASIRRLKKVPVYLDGVAIGEQWG